MCPGALQGYLREAKCHLAMGEIATAVIAYNKVLQLEPQNSAAKTEVSALHIVCCLLYCCLSLDVLGCYIEIVQRIFKRGRTQHTSLTPDEELNS